MAVKALFFGIDDLYKTLEPFYAQQIQNGNLEVVGYATIDDSGIKLFKTQDRGGVQIASIDCDIAILSPCVFTIPPHQFQNFYDRMKFLERNGFSRNRIIDGRVFMTPGFNLAQFLREGVSRGIIGSHRFSSGMRTIYQIFYRTLNNDLFVELGKKSYIGDSIFDGQGIVTIGSFCAIAVNQTFRLNLTIDHNYNGVFSYSLCGLDWNSPLDYFPKAFRNVCKIHIGSDVWVGAGCNFKATNPYKPLVIGDGAVIASDSVVVKNVPPYAIVGGNPAKIIKYRFPEKIIEALLRIKWWDWDIDKIHDEFAYFNKVEEFVARNDPEYKVR